MECPYCGREVKEGETFCECGRPINIAGTSGGASAGPMTAFEQQLSTQTLASVKQKKRLPILPLIILLLVCAGVGGFFGIRMIQDSNLKKPDTWEVVDRPEYTIKLPTALKNDTDRMVEIDSSVEKLDFFSTRKAAVYVTARRLTAAEQEMYKDTEPKLVVNNNKTMTINGQKIEPVERGKFMIFEYSAHRQNYISSTDDLWVIEANTVTKKAWYTIEVYCPETEKDTYREYMLQWIDSFTPKT